MSKKRREPATDLVTLYSQFRRQQRGEGSERYVDESGEYERLLKRLRRKGIVSVADLLERLPHLSKSMKVFGIDLISTLEIQQGAGVLMDMASDPDVRLDCAVALYFLNREKRERKVLQFFYGIGQRELASANPDRYWLEAVILGLGPPEERLGAELLVTIFERRDLPGWVRGDAADKLGCCSLISDRRTKLFRRSHDASLCGLEDESIDVQFWSMYLIGSLCSDGLSPSRSKRNAFTSALPKLRQIAATDDRLAPGYWWPMSAEAEDVIGCIENGSWPETDDASDRWSENTERGEWKRD